jgi:hypothetical protein
MRFVAALTGLLAGLAIGLWGGWIIWPVEYAEVTPELLSPESRVDYALMVATAYAADDDLPVALERLARLGESTPAAVLNAYQAAEGDPLVLAGLQKLAAELQLHATMPTPIK